MVVAVNSYYLLGITHVSKWFFISALQHLSKWALLSSMVKVLNFREGKWFVQVTQLERDWARI